MATLSFTRFTSLPRWHSNWPFFPSMKLVQLHRVSLRKRWVLTSVSKKIVAESLAEGVSEEEAVVIEKKARRTSKRAPTRQRKKVVSEPPEDNSLSVLNGTISDEDAAPPSVSSEGSKKMQRITRRKVSSASSSMEMAETGNKVTKRRRTKKKVDDSDDQGSEAAPSDQEGGVFVKGVDDDHEEDLEFGNDEKDDISFSRGWPPLVCCFGAAQHAFIPSARPANRLVDYEIHERMKDALWAPEKFFRAPGSCASKVALALARLGGKVAFMGKLGDDDYGQTLLYYLNLKNLQTRSVCIDSKRVTAVSQMKIGKKGGLRMTCVKPCAEDSLSRSEINIDVLKEAKMFYFNSFSLLDLKMSSTMLQAIKISKKLGGVIFYDLNLPLPLWQSAEETKVVLQEAWNLADIIEVSKQELEFLCGIKPSEKFDTKDNHRSKFVHYKPDVITPLWHQNLKVLFVTNGTSKIHYYTKEHNGAVLGMEDAPITPFTCDMSASGDGIVAGLMRMLTVQPHLITDKGYLEHSIKYAINCGVIDQWMQARTLGFPPKEGMEGNAVSNPNGWRSITEKEYRTLVPVS